ncbi:MAG: ABC transporter permease subunit, partial [Planctomycetota bacterium]
AWATMIGVLAVTPAVAAGAIASERERRTIEYLFATDLSNSEIVLDKLVARLLTVGKLVLATLPVLAIFRLLGGVPGSLLLTHFAMLASTATLTASIAIAVGVWCDRARDAVPRALGAVFVWLIALPLLWLVSFQLGFILQPWAKQLATYVIDPVASALALFHPIYVLAMSAGVTGGVLGVDADVWAIARMIGIQLTLAAAVLGICIAMVRRVHLRAVATAGARPKAVTGAPASRSPFERWPMLWKELFAASVTKRGSKWLPRIGVTLLVVAVGGPLVGMLVASIANFYSTDYQDYMGLVVGLVCVCGSILLLMLGSRAAGLITHERERDTWLSLLTTDLSSSEIIAAKTWGNLYALRWPLVGVMLMPLLGVLLDYTAVFATLGVIAALAAVGWATTSIGLAASLRMKSSTKAVGMTVFILLAIGAFYTPLAAMFFALGGGASGDAVTVIAMPPLVPFLLAFPVIVAVEGAPPDEVYVAFFAGLLFYTFVGFAMTASNINLFDSLCQRGIGKWGPQPSTPSAGEYPATGPLPPTSG